MSVIGRIFKKIKTALAPSQDVLKVCGKAIFIAALIYFIFPQVSNVYDSMNVFHILLFTVFYLALALLFSLLWNALARMAGRMPRIMRIAIAFAIFCVFLYYQSPKWFGWTTLAVLIFFPSFLAVGIRQWRREGFFPMRSRNRIWGFIALLLGTIGIVTSLIIYFWTGSPAEPVKNMRTLGRHSPAPITAVDPSKPGSEKVAFLTYGSGNDKHRDEYGKKVTIKTPTVDGSVMLKSWSGLAGKLRTWYFGFDNTKLPLNALVWYPENLTGKAPLVLVVHGNHLGQDYSDPGYDYLGELLASKGYIVASVDENFLNGSFTDIEFSDGLSNENGTRGWMLLKHLEQWRKWNSDPKSKFYGKVDMDRLAVMGHSRGGEAVGHAALFNRLTYFPDDANEKFDFNFNIKAYIAIAPVDGQYKPSGQLVPLRDVNYFVIHGSQDMDMASYGGLGTWKRLLFSPNYTGFKAGLYFHGANHGQFNTSWGRNDWSAPNSHKFNTRQLMSAKDQQQIAKVYITSFLEVNLRDKAEYKPLFMDYRYAKQWLPDVIYFNQFESSHTRTLVDFEEDMNLLTATVSGSVVSSKNLSVWREQQHKLLFGQVLSKACYIGWDRTEKDSLLGSFEVSFKDSLIPSAENSLLTFALTESTEGSAHKPKGKSAQEKKKIEKEEKKEKKKEDKKDTAAAKEPIDFTIEVEDASGQKIQFLLSDCSYLQPQVKRNLNKFNFWNETDQSEPIPNFFYFDLPAIATSNPSFNLKQIRTIRFVFDKKKNGVVILDDVELMEK